MRKIIEKFFINIENASGYLVNLITFFLMFILNPGHSFKEVQNKRMDEKTNSDNKNEISDNIDPDFFLKITEENLKVELNRGAVVDEKNKVLLTVAALLMAAEVAMITAINPKWIAILSIVPTMAALFLILVHFGVRVVPVPNYKEIAKENDLNNAKINLGKEYLTCESKYSHSNNYFVGVYRASCRAILLGILLIIPVFAFVGNNAEDKIIEMLKNNSELINLLKGPQGPSGLPGPMGPIGPKGEIGPAGPQGPMGSVFIEPSEKKSVTKKKY